MTQFETSYRLKVGGCETGEALIQGANLHEIFGFAERSMLFEPLEVYQGDRRVGILTRSKSGVWEIRWHASRGF